MNSWAQQEAGQGGLGPEWEFWLLFLVCTEWEVAWTSCQSGKTSLHLVALWRLAAWFCCKSQIGFQHLQKSRWQHNMLMLWSIHQHCESLQVQAVLVLIVLKLERERGICQVWCLEFAVVQWLLPECIIAPVFDAVCRRRCLPIKHTACVEPNWTYRGGTASKTAVQAAVLRSLFKTWKRMKTWWYFSHSFILLKREAQLCYVGSVQFHTTSKFLHLWQGEWFKQSLYLCGHFLSLTVVTEVSWM